MVGVGQWLTIFLESAQQGLSVNMKKRKKMRKRSLPPWTTNDHLFFYSDASDNNEGEESLGQWYFLSNTDKGKRLNKRWLLHQLSIQYLGWKDSKWFKPSSKK